MNNEDFSELFNKFSNMVNEGNIPDNMKEILSSISSNNTSEGKANSSDASDNSGKNDFKSSTASNSSIDFETILKMKSIIDKMNNNANDPRANLLLSLKPYLKQSRKDKVDQYVKLFGMSKVLEAFDGFRR